MIKLGLGSMQLLTTALKWVNSENAHAARNVADTGRLIPGTQVQSAFNKVTRQTCLLGLN
jgi:hypothetical protein